MDLIISDKEFIQDFAKNLCYKMADCSTEAIKKMPEAQRKQMSAYMPSHEKCDKEISKEFGKEEANNVTLTSAEKALGQECMDEVKNTACNQMQKQIASCKKFSSLVGKRSKS